MLKSALLMAAGVAIGFGASAVLAQNSSRTFRSPKSTLLTKKATRPAASSSCGTPSRPPAPS